MRVAFGLYGPDLEPSEVTRESGVTPSRSWSRSQPLPNGRPRADGLWILQSQAGEADSFDAHWASIVGLMREAWPTFVDLGRRHKAYVEGIVSVTGRPTISANAASIHSIGELGADLLFELNTEP